MSKKTKQTTEHRIPSWLEAGSKQAVALGQKIGAREYTPYEGERIAALDPNEQRAYEMAGAGVGGYEADLARSRELTEQGAKSFLDADMEAYMNPYVKGALDPAARELKEETQRQVALRGQEAGMAGAFGGARQAIAESETRRGGLEAVSDLYQKGYERAFESGAAKFAADRNAASRGAEQYRALGAQGQQQLTQDIQNLLTTGGMKRSLKQADLDFDYQQFVEARDWDVTNLQGLLASLSVPAGSTTIGTTKKSGLGNAIGVAAAAAGAILNPAGAIQGMMGGQTKSNPGDVGQTMTTQSGSARQVEGTFAGEPYGATPQPSFDKGFDTTYYGSAFQPAYATA